MPLANSPTGFGSLARSLHWLTALLILSAIGLGLYGADMPYGSGAELAAKAQVYSLHKTIGIASFAVALIRILWALTQPRPVPLHPERRLQTALADLVHWMLYTAMLVVPLSGWVTHAATTGFAPILWPFGQDLPLVPKSATVEHAAAAMHWLCGKLLMVSIALHIAGALKHHLIDRDATLRRMLSGAAAPDHPRPHRHGAAPVLAAVVIYAAGAGLAIALNPAEPAPATAAAPAPTSGNWQVTQGTLGFSIPQMGSSVNGSFATWTADIAFDEATGTGQVTVTIDMTSLALGSVSDQARAADFLDTATHPSATFTAVIRPAPDGTYMADGRLALHGIDAPLALSFALAVKGDLATMQAQVAIDRRSFGIGAKYPDEKTVGFVADVKVALTAMRRD